MACAARERPGRAWGTAHRRTGLPWPDCSWDHARNAARRHASGAWASSLLLIGALAATLRSVRAGGDARRAARARGPGAESRGHHRRTMPRRRWPTSAWRSASTQSAPRRKDSPPAASCSRIPPPGAPARQQRTIRVWVSSGPRATTVRRSSGRPNGRRRSPGEDGLEVAAVSEFRSPDYPADAVVAQDPPPTSRAPQRVAAAQSRRAGDDLRHARPDRHERRARRRNAADARLPRLDRRLAAVPGRAAGHRRAPAARRAASGWARPTPFRSR